MTLAQQIDLIDEVGRMLQVARAQAVAGRDASLLIMLTRRVLGRVRVARTSARPRRQDHGEATR
jgi:hypothetical protein